MTSTGGGGAAWAAAGFQTPSPGSAGWISGLIGGGSWTAPLEELEPPSATPTRGSERSGGPPFEGAVSV